MPLRDLPNQHGWRFTGILVDGSRVPCRVVCDATGFHRVDGAEFEELAGWEYEPEDHTDAT